MNILWLTQTLMTSKSGGTIGSTDRIEVPDQLRRLGHQVHLVVGESPSDILRGEKPLSFSDTIYLPMVNGSFLTTFSYQSFLTIALPFFMWHFDPDVVLIDYHSVISIVPWALLKRLGILRCIIILDVRTLPVDTKGWHGKISKCRFNLSLWFASRFMDGMTMITIKMRDTLAKRFAFSPDGVGVWESGVNFEQFQDAKCKKAELGWAGKFVVMYHGVLSPNRGLQDTISAFVQLKKEYSDIQLCLLGAGEAMAELQSQIERSNLEDVVMIYPPVRYTEVADYVASADVGIVPLPNIEWWSTSSPLKLMEYLGAGKPVIVSNIIAHRSVLGDSQCCYYLESVSEKAIMEGIRYFYARKSELNCLGSLGKDIVHQRYSWETQAKRLQDYLSMRIDKRAGQKKDNE